MNSREPRSGLQRRGTDVDALAEGAQLLVQAQLPLVQPQLADVVDGLQTQHRVDGLVLVTAAAGRPHSHHTQHTDISHISHRYITEHTHQLHHRAHRSVTYKSWSTRHQSQTHHGAHRHQSQTHHRTHLHQSQSQTQTTEPDISPSTKPQTPVTRPHTFENTCVLLS